jgi:hypothetical protein
MLVSLTNTPFEKLNHQHWCPLSSYSQALGNHTGKKAALGTGKDLYQPF